MWYATMALSERAPFSNSFRTSAFRLAIAYCLLFTVSVSALLGAIYLITGSVLANEVDNVILIELDALADEYDREGQSGIIAELTRLRDSWGRAGAIYLLVDPALAKRAGNLSAWPFVGVPKERWLEFDIEALRDGGVVNAPVRARVVEFADGYRLLVGTEVSERRQFQERFRAATLWAIGLTALLGALMGLWLSRRLMARVRAISTACQQIVAGDFARRLPVGTTGDEFDSLAVAVNHVLTRLDQQTVTVRATFDSAAHDLRGPLFRLRGRLEELQQSPALTAEAGASIDRALQDIDSVQRTLAILLQIAQAESGAPLGETARIDLGQLVQEITELYEPAARASGLDLACEIDIAWVNGHRQLLTQLLANLIENAVNYAGAGAIIRVRAHTFTEGARLEVADNGPGIPVEDRERALRPFVRLSSTSAAGSGLGLSLVAAIARLHQARLMLEDNTPGLRVVVQFQAQPEIPEQPDAVPAAPAPRANESS
jgi:signal transduction histidine kinase